MPHRSAPGGRSRHWTLPEGQLRRLQKVQDNDAQGQLNAMPCNNIRRQQVRSSLPQHIKAGTTRCGTEENPNS